MSTALYDLAKDPQETTDVSARNPNVVNRIEKIMRHFLDLLLFLLGQLRLRLGE